MAAVFAAIAAGGYGAWWWWQQSGVGAAERKDGKGTKGGRGAALIVKAAAAVVKPMPVLIEAVGTVEPEHSVQVRAQVSGVLQSVLFKEGDKVKAGQLLFQIDPRTFEASYRQMQAQLARDMAQLERAFQRVAARSGETEALHRAVYSAVTGLRFALYRDFPNAVGENS